MTHKDCQHPRNLKLIGSSKKNIIPQIITKNNNWGKGRNNHNTDIDEPNHTLL